MSKISKDYANYTFKKGKISEKYLKIANQVFVTGLSMLLSGRTNAVETPEERIKMMELGLDYALDIVHDPALASAITDMFLDLTMEDFLDAREVYEKYGGFDA